MFAHPPPRSVVVLPTVRAGPAQGSARTPVAPLIEPGALRRALRVLLAAVASARQPRPARLDELSPHLRADLGLPPVGPVAGPSFRGFPSGFVPRPPR
jgi:hypothetical protein